MAFALPREPLKPVRALAVHVRPGSTVLRADELQVLADGQQAIAAAAAQADLVLGQAQAAYEAEKRRGYAEGQEAARLDAAERLIENVARQVEFFSGLEGRMVDLVMNAVRTVIHGYDERERIFMTVRNVLAVARSQKQVTVRLAPAEVAAVRERIDTLKQEFPGIDVIEVVPDHRLEGDACVLETEVGVVEASLETQMKALRQAFERVLGSRA
jgi:type III secretion protein L